MAKHFADWSAAKIEKKLGIVSRHVLGDDETPSDLAVAAAQHLLHRRPELRERIDFIVFCTQSPDYVLPTNACLIQDRLGLNTGIGAIDVNQGCSGYIYGLGVAKGLVSGGLARCVLLLTADAYSKLVNRDDPSVRTIFGDAGSASVIEAAPEGPAGLGAFVFGTDGSGGDALIVRNSGMRREGENPRAGLFMDGPAVLNFTLREVPPLLAKLLEADGKVLADLDFVILHQANKFILDQLKRKLQIDDDKFIVDYADVGNTVSSSIPIALSRAVDDGRIRPGSVGALLGFGVGLSWAGCTLHI